MFALLCGPFPILANRTYRKAALILEITRNGFSRPILTQDDLSQCQRALLRPFCLSIGARASLTSLRQ